MARHHHSFARESAVTGLLGASAVALWFLVIDLIAGRPFSTPSVLGQVILFGITAPVVAPPLWPAVIAYTGLHVAVFLLFGMVVTRLVFLADRHMLALFALFMLFVAFEVFFYGLLSMLFEGTAGHFPIWQVLGANTLAAAAMGAYLIRRHPALRRRLHRQPLGALDQ